MQITLLNHTPLYITSHAMRTCYQSFEKGDNGGEKDKELINRIGNVYKHSSTLEHLNYNFYIKGISRACLQELARHRHASLSVKSTRYTLKELKKQEPFSINELDRASEFIVLSENELVNEANISSLNYLIKILNQEKMTQDIAKYALPESYKTELTWSINARSLQNFLHLRTAKAALKEIRELAFNIFDALPDEHKFIYEPVLNER